MSRLPTLFEHRRQYKRSRLALVIRAVRRAGSVKAAARMIQTDRGVIYRELREGGYDVEKVRPIVGRSAGRGEMPATHPEIGSVVKLPAGGTGSAACTRLPGAAAEKAGGSA